MTSTTSTTSTTTTCPVTPVTNAGAGTITTGLLNLSLSNLTHETESSCVSEHCLNVLVITEEVFNRCIFRDDVNGLLALACTNVTISENIRALIERINLIQLCP